MPLYTYECKECKCREENLVSIQDRDTASFLCPECGDETIRVVDAPVIGKPGYQMKAVMGNGEHVPGHFGKSARKK